jgi:hypothetical protein
VRRTQQFVSKVFGLISGFLLRLAPSFKTQTASSVKWCLEGYFKRKEIS